MLSSFASPICVFKKWREIRKLLEDLNLVSCVSSQLCSGEVSDALKCLIKAQPWEYAFQPVLGETSHLVSRNIPPCFQPAPWKAGGGVYTSGPWGQVTRLEIPGHEQSGVNSPVPTWAVSLFQLLSWLSWDPAVSWLLGWGFTPACGCSLEQEDVREAVNQWSPSTGQCHAQQDFRVPMYVYLCGRNGVRDPLQWPCHRHPLCSGHCFIPAVHCLLPVLSPCPNQRITLGTRWGSEASGDTAVALWAVRNHCNCNFLTGKAQSNSSCSLLLGLQLCWSGDIPPTTCGDLMLFRVTEPLSLLNRVQGGKTTGHYPSLGSAVVSTAFKI